MVNVKESRIVRFYQRIAQMLMGHSHEKTKYLGFRNVHFLGRREPEPWKWPVWWCGKCRGTFVEKDVVLTEKDRGGKG